MAGSEMRTSPQLIRAVLYPSVTVEIAIAESRNFRLRAVCTGIAHDIGITAIRVASASQNAHANVRPQWSRPTQRTGSARRCRPVARPTLGESTPRCTDARCIGVLCIHGCAVALLALVDCRAQVARVAQRPFARVVLCTTEVRLAAAHSTRGALTRLVAERNARMLAPTTGIVGRYAGEPGSWPARLTGLWITGDGTVRHR
jgi:hypothetical protein